MLVLVLVLVLPSIQICISSADILNRSMIILAIIRRRSESDRWIRDIDRVGWI